MAKIKNDEEFFAVIDALAMSAARIDTLESQRDEASLKLLDEWGKKIDAIKKPHKSDFKRAKDYAINHRERLLGKNQSAKTNVASWGFKINPSKVVPLVKIKDDAMVEQLLALPENRGTEYLATSYKLDKSKIADGLVKGVKWLCKLFQLTKDEQFFSDKIKENSEE